MAHNSSTAQHSTSSPNSHVRREPRDVVTPLRNASQRAGLPELAQRLEEVRLWLADDLDALNSVIVSLQQSSNGAAKNNLAAQAAEHLLACPGKRIRPLCVLLSAQLNGLPIDPRIRDLALASELVHAATLLHDDVIDEGKERRGMPSARVVYGNSASILGGDYLLIEALERVTHACSGTTNQQPLLSLLDTVGQMVAGEAKQLERRERFDPQRSTYLEVVDGKTASLFRWALLAPALLGPCDANHQTALARAGSALGLAFQLVDDVLDLEGQAEQTGKTLFADLLQGKLTWPLILASEAQPEIHEQIKALAKQAALGDLTATAAQQMVQQLREGGWIDATRQFAQQQQKIALEALQELPANQAREALFAVICAAVERIA